MKISVLCDSVQATQVISFLFDQSSICESEKIRFKLQEWSELKLLDRSTAYAKLFDCDYLILSRWYDHEEYNSVLDQAKLLDTNVFLHLDDFLFDVPRSIGEGKWKHYHNKDRVKALFNVAKSAKGMIVSTPRLAVEIQKILPNIPIYTCPFYKVFEPPELDNESNMKSPYPIIGYMGTKSHAEDLDLVIPTIEKLMGVHHNLKFEVFGLKPPKLLLEKYPDRCSAVKQVQNYQEFKSTLKSLGWWIGLAPIIENNFNYCKANTKLLEYIQAEIPVISSRFGPYEYIPSLSPLSCVKKKDYWLDNISRALYSRSLRSSLYQAQFDYCKQFSSPIKLVEFYRQLSKV